MSTWLIKSEPDSYSWDEMVRDGRTVWNGVRNHQAAANLRSMAIGDRALFYHSNIGKQAVGIVEIVRGHFVDPTDPTGKFVAVEVAAVEPLKRPVTLAEIKADPRFADLKLVTQSRLSVVPVGDAHWTAIIALSRQAG